MEVSFTPRPLYPAVKTPGTHSTSYHGSARVYVCVYVFTYACSFLSMYMYVNMCIYIFEVCLCPVIFGGVYDVCVCKFMKFLPVPCELFFLQQMNLSPGVELISVVTFPG
jgi:hypothetical protein